MLFLIGLQAALIGIGATLIMDYGLGYKGECLVFPH